MCRQGLPPGFTNVTKACSQRNAVLENKLFLSTFTTGLCPPLWEEPPTRSYISVGVTASILLRLAMPSSHQATHQLGFGPSSRLPAPHPA